MRDSDQDVLRLARALGLGCLPYRSFGNAPVRRPPMAQTQAADSPPLSVEAIAEAMPPAMPDPPRRAEPVRAEPVRAVPPPDAAEPVPAGARIIQLPAAGPAAQPVPGGFPLVAAASGAPAEAAPSHAWGEAEPAVATHFFPLVAAALGQGRPAPRPHAPGWIGTAIEGAEGRGSVAAGGTRS